MRFRKRYVVFQGLKKWAC